MSVAPVVFENPDAIGWIDLSFNQLTHIDAVLTSFENLKILYLHGNAIEDIKEVNKLAMLPRLMKLSLHGNPIENFKGYRQYVLSFLPHLVAFDFSRITKADKATAGTWAVFNNPHKKKSQENRGLKHHTHQTMNYYLFVVNTKTFVLLTLWIRII